MATEKAGHGVLTESNGAVDFTTDLGERPEPTARGFGRSSAILGASTLVAQHDLSDENQSTPQTPLFSQRDGPASTLSTAPAAATDEAQWEGLERRKRQRREAVLNTETLRIQNKIAYAYGLLRNGHAQRTISRESKNE